jgi:hypothetical protein
MGDPEKIVLVFHEIQISYLIGVPMQVNVALDSLASWLVDAQLESNAIRVLNEHYLHHWFTHSITSRDRSVSFEKGEIHPEWPTRKLAHNRVEEITYDASQRTYFSRDAATRRGAGHIDFALGEMNSPDVLLEFKWNDAYDEWEFDFLKMMDPRLSSKDRICFGVLPRGWHGERVDRAMDLAPINKRLRQAALRSRELMENPRPRMDIFPFTTRFYCVAVGQTGGRPVELIKSGHAIMAYSKLSSGDILNLPSEELGFELIPATDCMSAFKP